MNVEASRSLHIGTVRIALEDLVRIPKTGGAAREATTLTRFRQRRASARRRVRQVGGFVQKPATGAANGASVDV